MNYKNKWWLVPLVILLALLLKAGFVTAMVSGKIDKAATKALESDQVDNVTYVGLNGSQEFGADGLDIILEGPAAKESQAVAAVLALDEIDTVKYQIIDEAEPSATAVPASPIADPLIFTISEAGKIELTGNVKNAEVQETIVSAAQKEYGEANVLDRLVLRDDGASSDGQILLNGEAADETEQKNWVAKATAVAEASDLGLVDQTSVRPVEDLLNKLFELNPIQFDKNKATIRSASAATLDEAAAVIKANPSAGNFTVVGHTDSDGSSATNESLSQARAEAVVKYLVEKHDVELRRLEAEGRGEAELFVEPEVSSEDKQRNRRIEWELN